MLAACQWRKRRLRLAMLAVALVLLQQLLVFAAQPTAGVSAAAAAATVATFAASLPSVGVSAAASLSSEKMAEAGRRCRHAQLSPSSAPTDHTPRRFLLEPPAACAGRLFLLVFVHSALRHRQRRDLIRRTWASVANVAGDRVATIFVVGRSESQQEMRRLRQEAEEAQDLLQADFADTYRNLTYKHLYAIKWIARRCSGVRFVAKVDDDVVLNVFHLRDFLRDRLMDQRSFVLCQINAMRPFRKKGVKWTVSQKEWPLQKYPRYCKGLGYVMSGDILPQLHLCAKWRKYFWIDDVFVTGSLVQAMGVRQLAFEDGWGVANMHPKFVGPEADRVMILVSQSNEVMPRLHERVWNSMLRYSWPLLTG